jgi:dihydrofolate reductase
MRKISAGLFMSLDGVVEGPGPGDTFERKGWTMPYYSDEIGQVVGESFAKNDAMLLGRATYQTFAATFAPQTGGMADMMNNTHKYVVSNTLQKAEWNNSELITGSNIAEQIAALKQQPGKDIGISGSGTLVQFLLEQGLLNELMLLVYPVVIGMGKRMFKEGFDTTMKLTKSQSFSTGVVHLVYLPTTK